MTPLTRAVFATLALTLASLSILSAAARRDSRSAAIVRPLPPPALWLAQSHQAFAGLEVRP